jgi:hypothetical protein
MSTKQPTPDTDALKKLYDEAAAAQLAEFSAIMQSLTVQSETSVSQQFEDLSRDTTLAFAELHGKIDYLRSEINEVKQILNSLFR